MESKKLTNRDINRLAFNSIFLQASFNYERMQEPVGQRQLHRLWGKFTVMTKKGLEKRFPIIPVSSIPIRP